MARNQTETYDLSDAEKRDLIKLINEGKPLPEKYRFLLFADKREVELVWNGKTRDVCTAILPFQTLERHGTCWTPTFAAGQQRHERHSMTTHSMRATLAHDPRRRVVVVIMDVASALTDSADPSQFLERIRQRAPQLNGAFARGYALPPLAKKERLISSSPKERTGR